MSVHHVTAPTWGEVIRRVDAIVAEAGDRGHSTRIECKREDDGTRSVTVTIMDGAKE